MASGANSGGGQTMRRCSTPTGRHRAAAISDTKGPCGLKMYLYVDDEVEFNDLNGMTKGDLTLDQMAQLIEQLG
jgi:hypothetical protein